MTCSVFPCALTCERKRKSPSSGSFEYYGWIFPIAMVELGFPWMIHCPFSCSELDFDRDSIYGDFISANNFFLAELISVVPRDFMELTPLIDFLPWFPITLLFWWMWLVFRILDVLSLSFSLWFRVTFARIVLLLICKPKLLLIILLKCFLNIDIVLVSSS